MLYAVLALVALQCIALVLMGKTVLHLRRARRRPERELALAREALAREHHRLEHAEHQLGQNRDYLYALLDSLPQGIIAVDINSRVTHVNQAAAQFCRAPVAELLGRLLPELTPLPAAIRQWATPLLAAGESGRRELAHGDQAVEARIAPLAGGANGAVLSLLDIRFQRQLQANLVQTEKMSSLGQMAAGLAHEINNPLAAVLANVHTVTRRLTAELPQNLEAAGAAGLDLRCLEAYLQAREVPELLEAVLAAGHRAHRIVNSMLSFSRDYRATRAWHDLAQLLDESLELAASALALKLGEQALMPLVIRDYPPSLPPLYCSGAELQQVFLNIMLNAAQAMHQARTENPTLSLRVGTRAGAHSVTIEDNGPGIPGDLQERIFEPFFTTKPVGAGTGLGLSVSYFIVTDHHHGQLKVEPVEPSGTRFVIELPGESPPQLHSAGST